MEIGRLDALAAKDACCNKKARPGLKAGVGLKASAAPVAANKSTALKFLCIFFAVKRVSARCTCISSKAAATLMDSVPASFEV